MLTVYTVRGHKLNFFVSYRFLAALEMTKVKFMPTLSINMMMASTLNVANATDLKKAAN